MEKYYFGFDHVRKCLLEIDGNVSEIKVIGRCSYGVCGKDATVFLIDEQNNVQALKLRGAYINRILVYGYDENFFSLIVETFEIASGANPALIPRSDFSFELVGVL